MTAPAPRLFDCSGGDVRTQGVDGEIVILGADEQADLLDLFDQRRRAAIRARDPIAWGQSKVAHNQLSAARIEARKWARCARVVR